MELSLPTSSQVLVVGAGPSGIACALTLARNGVPVRIVDASLHNKNGCRAVIIHSHTLEALKTIGVVDKVVKAGIQAKGILFRRNERKLLEVNSHELRGYTEYPFTLLVAQHVVEQILRDELAKAGVKILCPHSVVGLEEDKDGDGLNVTFDDGSTVRSQYVVGADGSRSTIRSLANIDFRDPLTGADYHGDSSPEHTIQFLLADIYIDGPIPSTMTRDRLCLDLENFMFMCPLHSEREAKDPTVTFWRLGLEFSGGPSLPEESDIAYLQAEFDRRRPFGRRLVINSVEHSSRYRFRSALADTFFRKMGNGNILLLGDAAQVHSPAGGQGLNLGLCDAVGLGNTIHMHMSANYKTDTEKQSDIALIRYSDSRRVVASKVISMARYFTSLGAAAGWQKTMRDVRYWIIWKVPFLRKEISWRISGLSNREYDFQLSWLKP